jgi:asparagine synthase (glutamine-hydrolysing)
MCGIFGGILDSIENLDMSRALGTLRHRGPDNQGIWFRDNVFLGHTRLSIIDLTENANQPMVSSNGCLAVVFNGEIYNYKEIRRELEAVGYLFKSHSDTEVLVHGYAEFGLGIIAKLDGMFAVGIYDANRSELLLARDRMGKKPLYYALIASGIVFASEPKAILELGLIKPELAMENLPFLLSFGYIPPPATNYKNILQLPPASFLTFRRGFKPNIRKYWEIKFEESVEKLTLIETREQLRFLIKEAVQKRLESDVPLGAFLSGGVDSSLIVGLVRQISNLPLKTFSAGFSGDASYDEREYGRYVANLFGTEHFETVVSPADIVFLEKLIEIFDGPFGDSSMLPTYLVSKLSREHVKVVLSGDGGDELFCGYPRLWAGELAEFIPQIFRKLILSAWGKNIPESGSAAIYHRIRRFLSIASLPLPQRMAAWSGEDCSAVHQLVHPDLKSILDFSKPADWTEEYFESLSSKSVLSRILQHNFETYLPSDLMVKVDRSSMATGLEVRSPFLDTQLVEYASKIPAKWLHRRLNTKWILKEAFSDVLPKRIVKRKKMGFGMPLAQWFRLELKSYVMDNLAHPSREIYQYLNHKVVSEYIERHMCGVADNSARIWLWLTIQIWLKKLKK